MKLVQNTIFFSGNNFQEKKKTRWIGLLKDPYPWSESSAWSLPFIKLRFRCNLLAAVWTSCASSPFPNTSKLKPSRSFLCFDNKSINSLYPFAQTILPKKYAPFEKARCPSSLSSASFSPIFRNLGFTPWTLQITDLGKSWVAAERRRTWIEIRCNLVNEYEKVPYVWIQR